MSNEYIAAPLSHLISFFQFYNKWLSTELGQYLEVPYLVSFGNDLEGSLQLLAFIH